MLKELIVGMFIIVGLGGMAYFVRWLMNRPVPPDPWDEHVNKRELEACSTPVCMNCAKPVKNVQQHYCHNCGNITGEYTRYIPFVNIQFNYSIFGTLRYKLKGRETLWPVRGIYFFLILLLAPVMLVVGVPVILFIKAKKIINKIASE